MTDNRLEEYLAEAIRKNTPDILDDLLADIERAEAPITAAGAANENVWEEVRAGKTPAAANHKRTAGRMPLRAVMSIAAVFVLLIGGFTVFSRMQQTFAVVGLDVNPSIELSINSSNKVTEARAVNEEGEEILSDLNLKGADTETACYAITGAMLTKGYLTNTSNSILVSVRAANADKGREIEHQLAQNLNSYLGDSDINASVLGQFVEDDDELEAFAEANGISEGKAWLIKRLLASGSSKMTEESLLKLSTQELILLGQEKNISPESTYGSADTSKYISRDKAIETALNKAGIDRSKATQIKAAYDTDNGKIVYEVEFVSGGVEYEYDIDAVSGKVVSYESEKADNDIDDRDDDDRYDDDNDRDDDDRYDDDKDDRDDDRDDHDDYDKNDRDDDDD